MLSAEENQRFTQVGRGTPMGELLRCYWHPVGCTETVTKKPQRVKVLGEELVLYRGESGKPRARERRRISVEPSVPPATMTSSAVTTRSGASAKPARLSTVGR